MKKIFLFAILCLSLGILNAQWTTSGNDLYNSNSGNVGIGTPGPTDKLHVNGNLRVQGDFRLYTGNTDGARLIWYGGTNGVQEYRARVAPDGHLAFFPGEGIPTTLSLTQNGNVGIGTTSPATKLHVVGGNIAASIDDNLGGFVQLWNDNAIIWKNGNSNAGLRFGSATNLGAAGWSEKMRITDVGNVGIGVPNPFMKLTIVAGSQADGIWLAGTGTTNVALLNNVTTSAWNSLSQNGDNLLFWKGSTPDNPDGGGLVIAPWSNSNSGIRIASNGNVGIGTPAPQAKLAVNGDIFSKKIKVTQTGWPDYVFDNKYLLPTLAEIEKFIQQNKHLPEVPSVAEIEKDGLNLGDNQALLLKKIEELTLYMIEQNKAIEQLITENKNLKKEVQEIKKLTQK